MSSKSPRRALRRSLALSAAAGVLAVGPAMPAAAQGAPQPPPLDPGKQPSSGSLSPKPGTELKQACMEPSPGGSTIERKPWSQLSLGYEQAHKQGFDGSGERVAVIDTGVNEHPELAGRVRDGGGSAVPGPGGATSDCDGHGTLVAGFVAADGSLPNTGFMGVAPKAQILSIRQSSSHFQTPDNKPVGDTDTLAQAVQQAVDQRASVINISQASCQDMAQASNPANDGNQKLYNAVENARRAGSVVVAAAGNSDECKQNNPGSPTTAVLPAWFDNDVLTVGSVDQQGGASPFTVAGPWVDVAAPGQDLIGLDPAQGGHALATQIPTGQGQQQGPIQGTSFAAPYVSGLVALIKQKHPELGATQIMDRIKQTAIHPGGDNGRNDVVGYGTIDVMAALDDVVPSEHGKQVAAAHRRPLGADEFPHRNWPALAVAFGGAGVGIAAVLFIAFMVHAIRNMRARRDGQGPDDGI